MTHARILQTYALDLITTRIENGRGSPTDAEIASYCRLNEPGDARSLLADLADAGRITIKGTGAGRVITLGRQHAAPMAVARPTPSVKVPGASKRRLTLDETSARIKEILARGKAAVAEPAAAAQPKPKSPAICQPKPVSAPEPAPTPARAPVVDGAQRRGSHRDDAAPPPIHVEPLPPDVVAQLSLKAQRQRRGDPAPLPQSVKRVLSKPKDAADRAARIGKHCMTVALPTTDYWKLVSLAKAGDKAPGTLARELVLAALNGEMNPERIEHYLEPKPRIRGAIASAAVRDGMPILDFVYMLLERGFAAYEQDAAMGRAA